MSAVPDTREPHPAAQAAVTTPVEIFRLPAGIGQLHRLPGVGHPSIQDHVAGILDALATP